MRTKSVLGLILSAGLAANVALAGDATFYLTILHNNDGESQLINAGSGELENYGGAARFATVVRNLRTLAESFPPGNFDRASLLISSGDNFLAGPEFNASLENGVPFYDTIAMELIGYDAAAIGNHEFDFGPDVLADFIGGFNDGLPFVSSNLDFSGEQRLQDLVDADRIAPAVIVEVEGRDVGIIGATTPDLVFISSPRNVIVNPDVAAAVQTQIDALAQQGVEIIILSTHLQNINAELALVQTLRGVDAVIAGGGDELLANDGDLLVPGDTADTLDDGQSGYPVYSTDLDGREVPIVTTAGNYKYVGRLILGFDDAGNLVDVHPESGPDRVSGVGQDAVEEASDVFQQVTQPLQDAVDALENTVVGVSEVALDGRRSAIRNVETNLGNLCADSLLWTADGLNEQFGAGQPDAAIQNGGGIRNDSILAPGNLTELDTFNVLPFANFVSIVEALPAEQFKRVLENAVAFAGQSNGRFGQIAGMTVVYSLAGTAQQIDPEGNILVEGTRVRRVVLDSGRVIVSAGEVVDNGTVNVATIDFLARGGDQYPFAGRPFTTVGVTYQQALRNYIADGLNGVVSAADYPEGGEGRLVQLPACPADLDNSGGVDGADFLLFLSAFFEGSAQGDFNSDGNVDGSDFLGFLAAFFQGC